MCEGETRPPRATYFVAACGAPAFPRATHTHPTLPLAPASQGLLTNARFLALDEISTGLDSAVTLDIVRSLKARAQTNGLTVVIALLQPAPEVYACFDDVRGGSGMSGGVGAGCGVGGDRACCPS